MGFWAITEAISRRETLRIWLSGEAKIAKSSTERPMPMTPSMIAIVAGTAPLSPHLANFAVDRFSDKAAHVI